METKERIELIKKKIQEKSKNDIIEEMRTLNKSFNDLKYLITGSEKVDSIKYDEELIELFKLINNKLDNLGETRISNFHEFPEPKIISKPQIFFPKDIQVSNIKEARQNHVSIDWEHQPKQTIDFKNPLVILYKSIESFLKPIVDRVFSYTDDPNRIVITDEKVTEYYGNKTIIYKITDNGQKMEIKKDVQTN